MVPSDYAKEIARLQGVFAVPVVHDVDGKRINGASHHEEILPPAHISAITIDPDLPKERPIILPSDLGPAAGAYRMLRTQLLQLVRVHGARTVGIVSAADNEGKTLTAVNLALSLAVEPNQSVLLIDLDLRRPGVLAALRASAEHGLESWLDGAIETIPEIIYPVEGFERLSILPTVSAVPHSSETLAASRTQAMLAELKTADPRRLLLLDLPPLLLTDDFLTVASHLDGVVVVAREGRTKREDLERMKEALGSVRVLGTVLNHSTQFERRAY